MSIDHDIAMAIEEALDEEMPDPRMVERLRLALARRGLVIVPKAFDIRPRTAIETPSTVADGTRGMERGR